MIVFLLHRTTQTSLMILRHISNTITASEDEIRYLPRYLVLYVGILVQNVMLLLYPRCAIDPNNFTGSPGYLVFFYPNNNLLQGPNVKF